MYIQTSIIMKAVFINTPQDTLKVVMQSKCSDGVLLMESTTGSVQTHGEPPGENQVTSGLHMVNAVLTLQFMVAHLSPPPHHMKR